MIIKSILINFLKTFSRITQNKYTKQIMSFILRLGKREFSKISQLILPRKIYSYDNNSSFRKIAKKHKAKVNRHSRYQTPNKIKMFKVSIEHRMK